MSVLLADKSVLRITNEPLCPGRIDPKQYGQFIEYLCTLVPGMWAEKLYDTSFVGLSPYKFAYVRETDFQEKPWYPFGQPNRLKVGHDEPMAPRVGNSEKIELTGDTPCEGGIAQDGVSVNKGVGCRFSIFARAVRPGRMRVRLFHGTREYAASELSVGTEWSKLRADLVPGSTDPDCTFAITFEGPGTYWLDCASLMPDDSLGGWRRDVVKVLRELKPGAIRVGGSVMDDANLGSFEWSETVGPVEKRIPFPAWGGLQPPGAGLEEVVQLIQMVGAEPVICVRYEKKTPKDAAAEVQYFNGSTDTPMGALRAKNGHPEPYGIKFWQVGNERWGEEYWQAVPRFCRAMRAADPSIKLLSSFPSDRMIEVAGADLDYICPHQYDVANLDGTANELNDVRRMIREHPGSRPHRVAVTEWNTTAGDMGLGRAKLWTLRNALDCSRYQNLLHRNADMVEIANRSNLTNSFCSGIIQTNRSGVYLTPTYYAQRLYSNYAGTRPLRIEGENSLDYSATLSEDGKWLTLFAINEQQVPVVRKIDLSALGSPGEAEVWTLTDRRHAGQPDVSNSFEEPDRVSPVGSRCRLADGVTLEPLSLTVLRVPVKASRDGLATEQATRR